jgi:hypothetical protein
VSPHDSQNGVNSLILHRKHGICKFVLQMFDCFAMMVQDLFGGTSDPLLRHVTGLRLCNSGLEDADVVDDQLEVRVSKVLDTRDSTKGSEDALGDEGLNDWLLSE